MINYTSVQWGCTIVLSLGLTACTTWDTQRPEHVDARYEPITQSKSVTLRPKPIQKTYATKDPSQQATPGPVRKTAPQLPVIQ